MIVCLAMRLEHLHPNWFLEGILDFEYQQYRLLSYIQKVQKSYIMTKIYPVLSELIETYDATLNLYEQLSNIKSDSEDTKTDTYNTIIDILSFSLEPIKNAIDEGVGIYKTVQSMISVEPVGAIVPYKDEGYLIIHRDLERTAHVYMYEHKNIIENNETFRAIRLLKEGEYDYNPLGLSQFIIKEKVIKKHKYLCPMSFFLVSIPIQVPLEETMLPIVKRDIVITIVSS